MSEEASPSAGMPAEVSRSLSTVWKRYSTERPEDAETEINGEVVRCVLRGAVGNFEQGMKEQVGVDGASAKDFTSYRREASAAIAKATHRRVLAFISDHDAETDVATEVFVLDATLRRPPAGSDGAIVR